LLHHYAACRQRLPVPLKVSSSNPHLLVDQIDVPFLIHGDAAQTLIVTPDRAGVEEYLENRREKGFNTVVVMLIANHVFINRNRTANHYGVEPFKDSYDFMMPNEAYFANADWVIDRAAERGIQVVLTPSYVGYDSDRGWQDQIVANGTSKCRSYGRFLGKRYKDKPKIYGIPIPDVHPLEAARVSSPHETDRRELLLDKFSVRRSGSLTVPLFDDPTEIMKMRVARFEVLEVHRAAFTLQQRLVKMSLMS
jgi:hypothetical protein